MYSSCILFYVFFLGIIIIQLRSVSLLNHCVSQKLFYCERNSILLGCTFTNTFLCTMSCTCTQAIVAAGCLVGLADQLRNSRNVPELVLSEVSAALAVLASDGVCICPSDCVYKHFLAFIVVCRNIGARKTCHKNRETKPFCLLSMESTASYKLFSFTNELCSFSLC